jgi:acetyl-CoA/propionyl-CoA carboxylase biotin carboxyl carrier protein
MFDTVLIANRGEIALRVMRACRELGLRAVAVYSEADRDAPHVAYADAAFLLGPAPAAESYLHIERVIEAARRSGAGAIHPGYGFLSENPAFARAVAEAGLVFVGPPPEAMERLGGKVAARREAVAADVPIVPGTLDPVETPDEARRLAAEYGYPVAIKAVGGGGGRGLRVVRAADEVESAFESARREAEAAFKNGALYIERYLDDPRHIEIQLLADAHGSAVALGERDCSVQRRHQKLIEECPSPALPPELRAELSAAAVRLARAVGYVGAGTLEFLYQDGHAYFLEMNTRIQVEHTVTEMVYGVDLVKAQLRVAQGEPLWLRQEDLAPRGHAIECRINAEDPANGFRPALGTIGAYAEPSGFGVRVDSGVRAGWTIPQHYDSLLAKLVCWGEDRADAIARARRALADYRIEGVVTTIPFHRAALAQPAFASGDVTVNFIPRHPQVLEIGDWRSQAGESANNASAAPQSPISNLSDEARTFDVEVNGRRLQVRVAEIGAPATPSPNGNKQRQPAAQRGHQSPDASRQASSDAVVSPIQGTLVATRVAPGQQVAAGDVLFVVEAMKMENEVAAPRDGTIASVEAQPGASIEAGAVLARYQE